MISTLKKKKLFLTLTFSEEIIDQFVLCQNSKIKLREYVDFVAIKNGMHDSKGYIYSTNAKKSNFIEIHKIKKSFQIIMKFNKKNIKICILGLGYVGLPLALKLSEKFKVTGFDINPKRISQLKNGYDITQNLQLEIYLKENFYTNNSNEIKSCNFFIITSQHL